MPIIKSAIKRVRQSETRRKRNLVTKNTYKDLSKEFVKLVEAGDKKAAAALFPKVQKAIAMAAKKNVLQKNTAGRRTAKLARMIKGEKVTAIKTAAPKKAAAKKAPAKKPAAKKTTAKKAE